MPPDAGNGSLPCEHVCEHVPAIVYGTGRDTVACGLCYRVIHHPWIVLEQQTGADLLDLLESLHPAKEPDAQPTKES